MKIIFYVGLCGCCWRLRIIIKKRGLRKITHLGGFGAESKNREQGPVSLLICLFVCFVILFFLNDYNYQYQLHIQIADCSYRTQLQLQPGSSCSLDSFEMCYDILYWFALRSILYYTP